MEKKKYKILETEFEGRVFRIEEDFPDVGAYLLISENGNPLGDYLQDTIEICKEQANELYGVSIDSWILVGFSD